MHNIYFQRMASDNVKQPCLLSRYKPFKHIPYSRYEAYGNSRAVTKGIGYMCESVDSPKIYAEADSYYEIQKKSP